MMHALFVCICEYKSVVFVFISCRAMMGLYHQQISCNDLHPNADGYLIA